MRPWCHACGKSETLSALVARVLEPFPLPDGTAVLLCDPCRAQIEAAGDVWADNGRHVSRAGRRAREQRAAAYRRRVRREQRRAALWAAADARGVAGAP